MTTAIRTVDNGTGTDYGVLVDNVDLGDGVADAQYLKILDGTEGGTIGAKVEGQGDLNVRMRAPSTRIAVTSGGLTTTASAYAAGDQVGTLFTFASCARASGGTGKIIGASLVSAADTIGGFDLVVFRASVTLASDNAVFAISDGDALLELWVIPMYGAYDIGNNRVAQSDPTRRPYDCSGGTSLYGALITRSPIAATPFGAVGDILLSLHVEPD